MYKEKVVDSEMRRVIYEWMNDKSSLDGRSRFILKCEWKKNKHDKIIKS